MWCGVLVLGSGLGVWCYIRLSCVVCSVQDRKGCEYMLGWVCGVVCLGGLSVLRTCCNRLCCVVCSH